MHEAFAEPVNLQVQAGLMTSRQPPARIEETRPAGPTAGRCLICLGAGLLGPGARRVGVGSRFLGANRQSEDRIPAAPLTFDDVQPIDPSPPKAAVEE